MNLSKLQHERIIGPSDKHSITLANASLEEEVALHEVTSHLCFCLVAYLSQNWNYNTIPRCCLYCIPVFVTTPRSRTPRSFWEVPLTEVRLSF